MLGVSINSFSFAQSTSCPKPGVDNAMPGWFNIGPGSFDACTFSLNHVVQDPQKCELQLNWDWTQQPTNYSSFGMSCSNNQGTRTLGEYTCPNGGYITAWVDNNQTVGNISWLYAIRSDCSAPNYQGDIAAAAVVGSVGGLALGAIIGVIGEYAMLHRKAPAVNN